MRGGGSAIYVQKRRRWPLGVARIVLKGQARDSIILVQRGVADRGAAPRRPRCHLPWFLTLMQAFRSLALTLSCCSEKVVCILGLSDENGLLNPLPHGLGNFLRLLQAGHVAAVLKREQPGVARR